jgi:3-phenylpropionate/trans-cinnamate dioxygenase ferredoxin reductase component
MEYTGDIGPSRYDHVIFRRYPDPRQLIVFWLSEQRVQAGMNINIWEVADDIERLVQSPHPADIDDLAHPAIPLASLLHRPAGRAQCCSVRDDASQRTVT